MDRKEYITRQLARTKNKKFEAYVVSRIIHLLNDLEIKFVTQQYVSRPNGRALTDLYFPQVDLHIEVDEPYHKDYIENDKIREADIINATNHEVLRVDVSKSIEDINLQVNVIIDRIRGKVKQLKAQNLFTPWDIDLEFSPETYIKLGYIDISDNVAFKTTKDVCNCFGHSYDGWMKGGADHPDSSIRLWFPMLYPNGKWRNNISPDEEIITERNEDDVKAKEHLDGYLNQTNGEQVKRIVFAKVKGNLGDTLYRFRGLYELSFEDSKLPTGLVWRRTSTRVKTYAHDIFNKKIDDANIRNVFETAALPKEIYKTNPKLNTSEITKAHILECYEAYIQRKPCPFPVGMSESSAKMTMSWLDAIWNDRRCKFSGSAMQYDAVLAKIKADFGAKKACEVALSIERDLDLQSKTYGTPRTKHRQAIKMYLLD